MHAGAFSVAGGRAGGSFRGGPGPTNALHYSALFYLAVIGVLVAWVTLLRRREADLAAALEKNRKERKTTFAFLNSLGERLTAESLAVEPTLRIITEFLVDTTEAEAGAAFLVDPVDGHLSAITVEGMFPPLMPTTSYVLTKQRHLAERVKRERIGMGQGVIGMVAESGEPALILDAANDPRIPKASLELMPMRSLLAVPLKSRGRVLGVLAVVNRRGTAVFDQEIVDLVVSLADQAASTVELVKLYGEVAEKQRIQQELRLAHEFQQLLLPSECPRVPGFELAAFSAPALEVGGDYYDFFWVDEARRYMGIAIADVSGKGIPAGLVMSVVRCTMRAVGPGNMSPRDVLMKANDRVYADTKENVFVTMTYGILDTVERTFRFCRAGHEPLVLADAATGAITLSAPDGIAVGLVDGEIFATIEELTVTLAPGETAVLYTDGVVEAMDDHEHEYGQQRFFDLVSAGRADGRQQIIENALSDIRKFTRGHPQHDDITMVALRVLDEAPEPAPDNAGPADATQPKPTDEAKTG